MIAVDTNILVYAHRADSPFHDRAQSLANLAFIAEEAGHLAQLESLAVLAKTQGGAIHDARIAAICLSHGVVELWSADRDFSRFPALAVRNPLVA